MAIEKVKFKPKFEALEMKLPDEKPAAKAGGSWLGWIFPAPQASVPPVAFRRAVEAQEVVFAAPVRPREGYDGLPGLFVEAVGRERTLFVRATV